MLMAQAHGVGGASTASGGVLSLGGAILRAPVSPNASGQPGMFVSWQGVPGAAVRGEPSLRVHEG